MTNRSILVAVAIALLASGVSATPSFAMTAGANGGAPGAASAGTSAGGHAFTYVREPEQARVVVNVDPKTRCGRLGDQYAFDIKCRPVADFGW